MEIRETKKCFSIVTRAGVISNAIAFISQPREERNRGIEFRGILLVSKGDQDGNKEDPLMAREPA